jgi:hypothetical protein
MRRMGITENENNIIPNFLLYGYEKGTYIQYENDHKARVKRFLGV